MISLDPTRPLHRLLANVLRQRLRAAGYDIVRHRDIHSLGQHLQVLFAQREIDSIVDVGAFRGDYGSFVRRLGYHGPIASFEPAAASYAELARNCAGDDSWSAYRLALGSRNEVRELNVTNSGDFSSFLERTPYSAEMFGDHGRVEARETVEVRRLDEIFDDCVSTDACRVLLKVDTQGWDLEAIEGAHGCLPRVVALQFEVSVNPIYHGVPDYLDALREVAELGFVLSDLVPVVRDKRHHVVEFDCVMVRPDS
ncbi:MAG: FkbM family methyltransferase [Actinobacteria bacterium]|nr:FkbM family methyltransferase [Actinomycetota bacterium]